MLIRPSLVFVLSLAAALTACSNAVTGSAVPSNAYGVRSPATQSLDAVLDAAPQVSGGHMLFRKLSIQPNANTPKLLMNFLANGPNQAGVPCINCVNGASTQDNVGMTGPSNYVAANFVWQYGMSFTDISYKGKCKLAWAITAGKKTVDSFSATVDLKSAGGFILYGIARPRPSYSGAATETGKFTCGKTSQSQQVPLQFQ